MSVYTNKEWCKNAVVVFKHFSPWVEYLIVKCQLCYLSKEVHCCCYCSSLPATLIANVTEALLELYSNISDQVMAYPDGFSITAGDLHHANLKTDLPSFDTRGENPLYLVYIQDVAANVRVFTLILKIVWWLYVLSFSLYQYWP